MNLFNANNQSNPVERKVSPEVQQLRFIHYGVVGESRADMENLIASLHLLDETLAAKPAYTEATPAPVPVQPDLQTTHSAEVTDLEKFRHERYARDLVDGAYDEAA